MTTKILQSFSAISDNYDAVFCDVWGVMHNGRAQFTPAIAALRAFKASGKPVILISNSPRPSSQIPAQLENLGIQNDCYHAIVTSGDATIIEAKKHGKKAFRIGPPKDDDFFAAIGAEYVSIEAASSIICTGPRNDLKDAAEDYREELGELVKFGLPFICANPDKVVQYGGRLIPCGGALAEIYEQLGGVAIMAGKPFAPIYEITYEKCTEVLGRPIDKSRILCIGDGINTDVKGANQNNYDCLFISDGIHAEELMGENGLDEAKVEKFLIDHELQAKFAMPGLA